MTKRQKQQIKAWRRKHPHYGRDWMRKHRAKPFDGRVGARILGVRCRTNLLAKVLTARERGKSASCGRAGAERKSDGGRKESSADVLLVREHAQF